MLIANISYIGWLHTIACLSALPSGAYVLAARKGTRRHRFWGWWYVGAMVTLSLSSFFVYRFDLALPQMRPASGTFGLFHGFAVLTLASVGVAVIGAIRQRRSAPWAHVHAQAMLGSYYGLVGGLINEMFARIVPLRDLALHMSPHAGNITRTVLVGMTQSAAMMAWLVFAAIFFGQIARRRRAPRAVFTIGHPMRYSGGAFLIATGAGIVIGALAGGGSFLGWGVLLGMICGAIAMIRTRPSVARVWGTPSRRQTHFMLLAVGLEFGLFFLLGASGFFRHQPRDMAWEAALAIVGAHFLVMRGSHGPLMTWLGLAVLAWLGIGATLHLPLPLMAAGDGLIKLGFGLAMAEPLLFAGQTPSLARTSEGVAPSSRRLASVTA
jgi:uncharacterized membrane protein